MLLLYLAVVCVMTGTGYLVVFPAILLGLWLIIQVGTKLEKLAHSISAAADKSVYWIDATIEGWLG